MILSFFLYIVLACVSQEARRKIEAWDCLLDPLSFFGGAWSALGQGLLSWERYPAEVQEGV